MGLEGGYVGQILRVNLGKKSLEKAKIPERMLQQFLGGRGLGIKMLWDETAANTDAFDPSMVLIFWTGPYTGTGVFSAFFNVTTRSPLTGLAASAHSGGEWGLI